MILQYSRVFLLLLLIPAIEVHAQEDWIWQNPLPQGHFLHDIHAFSRQHAVAVGDFGTIIETRDGGQTWTFQKPPTARVITSEFFLNRMVGWAVTSDLGSASRQGEIIHTRDGGRTWEVQYSSGIPLSGVQFLDQMTGWAVGRGGTVLSTADEGETWRELTRVTSKELYSLHFLDPQTGWCVGQSGVIIKTEDGGESWSFQNCGRLQGLSSVFFIDPLTGWAAGGGGIILNTVDGGETWNPQRAGRRGVSLSSIHMSSRKNGYAVGRGLLLQTIDGKNWLPHAKGTPANWSAVDVSPDETVWVVGENRVLRSVDSGHPAEVKRRVLCVTASRMGGRP